MMTDLEGISTSLRGSREVTWELVYRLFRFCMHLVGFNALGARGLSVVYWQTPSQHYTNGHMHGGDPLAHYHDRQDAISMRASIVQDLRSKGMDDFSLVLNTSEYEVKRLRSNAAPDGRSKLGVGYAHR